jgi:hypothetical protein
MKNLKDTLSFKKFKKTVVVIEVLIMIVFSGCDSSSGSDSSDSSGNSIPTISSIEFNPAEGNEGDTISGQVNVSGESGNKIYYFTDGSTGAVIDKETGVIAGTLIEVDEETSINETFYACNEDVGAAGKELSYNVGKSVIIFSKNSKSNSEATQYSSDKCSSKIFSISVLNVEEGTPGEAPVPPVPPVENVAPVINIIDFDASANASKVNDNTAAVTWGRDIFGSIGATDANQDTLNYNSGVVSGDKLTWNYQNGENFSFIAFQIDSTDATADLGSAFFEASDPAGLYNKVVLNFVGNNPVQEYTRPIFSEDGKFDWISDATSDGSDFTDTISFTASGGYYTGTPSLTGSARDGKFTVKCPIVNDYQSLSVTWENEDGDKRIFTKGFTPATEAEAREKIEEEFAKKGWVEDTDFAKDTSIGFFATKNCDFGVIGDYLNVPVDYSLPGAKSINFTSFDDILATDYEGYRKLDECRDSGKSLQLSRFPESEVEKQTNDFIN